MIAILKCVFPDYSTAAYGNPCCKGKCMGLNQNRIEIPGEGPPSASSKGRSDNTDAITEIKTHLQEMMLKWGERLIFAG